MTEVIGFIADHPTPKINVGGGIAYTLNSRDYKGVMIVVVSENDRPLMANSHPGSYCGQDAYNDMFVTEKNNGLLHRQRTSASALLTREGWSIEHDGRSAENSEGGARHGNSSKKVNAT